MKKVLVLSDSHGDVEAMVRAVEREKPEIKEQMAEIYRQGKERRFLVAVFLSGREELDELTSALLRHNRDKLARQEVQRQRKEKKGA